MYSWLWNNIPGKFYVKVLLAAGMLAVVLMILYFLIFPWLDGIIFGENEEQLQ